jgi:tricorn protease
MRGRIVLLCIATTAWALALGGPGSLRSGNAVANQERTPPMRSSTESVPGNQTEKPLLLQKPAVSRTQIAFLYARDLWIVDRQGGEAKRLTAGARINSVGPLGAPIFSPDGTQIAFTADYDGNQDVYVVPSGGGVPRRLTYHPAIDWPISWTPDGKQVLFVSLRHSHAMPIGRLFTMPVDGVFPTEIPLPNAFEGSFSPDGTRLAYVPGWLVMRGDFGKRYRGGATTPVWLANLADSSIEKLPRKNSNDFSPMWIGQRVYFLSDRTGPVRLFAYDTVTKEVTQLVDNDGPDLKSASAGPGVIVYEQFGSLHLFDLNSRKEHRVNIRVAADMPEVQPRFKKVKNLIREADLAPTGARAVFEARGEIFTVSSGKGEIRNLTNTSGVAERDPSWSPDGKWIAYFSDESGEYALHLREESNKGRVRKIRLGEPPTFYFSPVWSPDGEKIAYTDARGALWYVETDSEKLTRVGTARDPAWSPDSRWLAYTRGLRNGLKAVFVHELVTGKNSQLTDGTSDARSPAFDRGGKYLYFTASTDVGPRLGFAQMSGYNHKVTRHVYVIVLSQDLPSPLEPENDEEKRSQAGKSAQKSENKTGDAKAATDFEVPGAAQAREKGPVQVRIDQEKLAQRILALPIQARDYTKLVAGKIGTIFLLDSEHILHRFDLVKRKTEKLLEGVSAFKLSQNGEKLLYRHGDRWAIAGTTEAPKPDAGTLSTDRMEMWVEPRVEWRQMYREVWRIVRDFFYDPDFHGLNLKVAEKKYAPYLDQIASRDDLDYLFAEMLGELSASHIVVSGSDGPEVKRVPIGLLGADYCIENGRYRFTRIYEGDIWDPDLRAPLMQPGVKVVAGDYLLGVNGRELRASDNLYQFFAGLAGKSVVLKVSTDPNGTRGREVRVRPVEDELSLRRFAWTEENRRKVHQMSGGRIAYVYLPDTRGGGYANFNRYYLTQADKQGAVIDERFNSGGDIPDYIIDALRRPLLNYWTGRDGTDLTTPGNAIFGPKAMLVNEGCVSGGDTLPWQFRKAGIGPLVGMRTMGAGLAAGGTPHLIDGGNVRVPNRGFFDPATGKLAAENRGVAPDIEVELDPKSYRAGRDPQLEKAVEWVLKELEKNPRPKLKRPVYPDYYKDRAR